MIKHHAFFDALGGMQEKSPDWNSVFAGLSVLRLLDRLAELRGPNGPAALHELDSSRRAVEAVSEGDASRAILLRILEGVTRSAQIDDEVGSDLIAYGRALDLNARWSLAADVFTTVADTFSERTSPQLVIEASTLLGAAARNTGDWDTSARGYSRAEHLAESIGDRAGSLTAQVGMANSEIFRGNLQSADESLEVIVSDANFLHLQKVEAIALHTRSLAALLRGDYQKSIHFAYRSLELTTNQSARDRVLADIAAAYTMLGMLEPARHGHSIVALTSPHQAVRWQATLNLMEVAMFENNEAAFDDYRGQLESAALDPRLKTYFLFYKARGWRHFNRSGSSELLKAAEEFANANRLHQVAFEIEKAMSDPEPTRLEVTSTPELDRIAEALGHLHDASTRAV